MKAGFASDYETHAGVVRLSIKGSQRSLYQYCSSNYRKATIGNDTAFVTYADTMCESNSLTSGEIVVGSFWVLKIEAGRGWKI